MQLQQILGFVTPVAFRLEMRRFSLVIHPLPQLFCLFENLLDSQHQIFTRRKLANLLTLDRRAVLDSLRFYVSGVIGIHHFLFPLLTLRFRATQCRDRGQFNGRY